MSALEMSPGQAIDRQAIALVKADVALKTVTEVNDVPRDSTGNALQRFKPQQRIDPKPYTDEANAIQLYLDRGYYLLAPKAINPQLNGYIVEMKSIHTRLFKLKDEIRSLAGQYRQVDQDIPSMTTIIHVAFAMVEMEDARHELIRKIDALFGIASPGRLHGVTSTARENVASSAATRS